MARLNAHDPIAGRFHHHEHEPTSKQDKLSKQPERKLIAAILLISLAFALAGKWVLDHSDSWLIPGLILLIWGIGGIAYSVILTLGTRDE